MIKAVIFDMDGVIIDSEGIYLNYLYEYAKTKNPEVTLESLHGTVGTTKQDCWMVVEKAIHNGQTWQELHDEYLGRWTDIFNSIDYLSIFRPEILDVIKKKAVLNVLADSYIPQSGSISADGLSQSMSMDISKYSDAIDDIINGPKGTNGGLMTRIHGIRSMVF